MRVPSVPLIVNDPYFSIWSPSDKLNESHTENWTGAKKRLMGYIQIDNKKHLFMGADNEVDKIMQTNLVITPTQTFYTFANEQIQLEVTFITHILLENLKSVSDPVTYVRAKVKSLDNKTHEVQVIIKASAEICYDGEQFPQMIWDQTETENAQMVWTGRAGQGPFSSSGDLITIDWGYLYVAAPVSEDISLMTENNPLIENCTGLCAEINFKEVGEEEKENYILFAYDDIQSILYFGDARKAYWAENDRTIFQVIAESIMEYDKNVQECNEFDCSFIEKAEKTGGKDYRLICSLAYRQSISAHKLILNKKGEVIFLSKECSSNGCIGTVDISYPSIPLFLMYNPELVKGMIRPVFEFAKTDVWEFDFAPHDVGRYPHACGQLYGTIDKKGERNGTTPGHGEVQTMIYQYPKGKKIYEKKYQMPVEECGNMVIITGLVYLFDKDKKFVLEHLDTLKKWTDYLVDNGADPGEQLCTDDFAGHLNHNVNLSAKAIVGIKLFSMLLKDLEEEKEALHYETTAHKMAKEWEKTAVAGEYTKLTFDKADSWSLKYNIVWDALMDLGLFSKEIFEKEVKYYLSKTNRYGTPLDSRESYTKSDWLVWVATMAEDKNDFEALIKPIVNYLEESESRVPFSDWYDTKTAKVCNFKNRTVLGGLFLPLLKEILKDCGSLC